MAQKVAGVVLASGMSLRFGAANKLLLPLGGVPLVVRTVTSYVDAELQPVVVVLGHDAGAVQSALDQLPVTFVPNPAYRAGQSQSLARGVRLVLASGAAVIGVADQPLLSADVIRGLVRLYRISHAPIVAPRYAGRRGNPVLFARSLFPELLQVTGDVGGRPVIEARMKEVAWLDVDDERLGLDIDTEEDAEALLRANDLSR